MKLVEIHSNVQEQKSFDTLAKELLDIKAQINLLEEKEEALEKEIVTHVQGDVRKANGLKVEKIYRKGNVDYSKIPQLMNLDLESFRKPGSYIWTFRPWAC